MCWCYILLLCYTFYCVTFPLQIGNNEIKKGKCVKVESITLN